MRRPMIVVSVVLAIGLISQDVLAQTQRRGTTGATTGNQAFSVGGRTTGGQGSAGNFGIGTAGQIDTNARFMRDNRQGAFVGADSRDADFVGAASAGTASQTSRTIRRGGGGTTQANVNRGGGRGRQRDDVRVALQIGFTPPNAAAIAPAYAPEAVASRLAGRMERSSWIENRSPLQVTIDQGTATLRGAVATEHDRVLAERLALLEGGIWKVENLLRVDSTAPDSQEAPALLEPMPEPSRE